MELSFSTGEAARAAVVPRATLQTWMHREYLVIPDGAMQGGEGTGNHRRLSLPALMQVVVGADLVSLGLPASVAFRAAARFAYRAKTDGEKIVRHAGLPFHWSQGQSLLLIPSRYPEEAETVAAPDGKIALWEVPMGAKNFVTVDVGYLFEDALKSLEIDPVNYLNAAYGFKPRT